MTHNCWPSNQTWTAQCIYAKFRDVNGWKMEKQINSFKAKYQSKIADVKRDDHISHQKVCWRLGKTDYTNLSLQKHCYTVLATSCAELAMTVSQGVFSCNLINILWKSCVKLATWYLPDIYHHAGLKTWLSTTSFISWPSSILRSL